MHKWRAFLNFCIGTVAENWRASLRLEDISPFSASMWVMPESAPPSERPLRRDAERNRQRILDAARVVFAGPGLRASHDDIAREAGVGVGTVYRRFPDKEQLIDALFEQAMEDMVALAE